MQAEDRIIHFSAELIHRPIQSTKEGLQQLYFDLSKTRATYDNTDFSNPAQVKFSSRRGKKTQSVLVILPDRGVVVEEWADQPLAGFLERIAEIAPRLMAARGVDRYLAHTATIRSTFALTHWDDAREFILEHMCGQKEALALHLERSVAVGGLRLVLPDTEEHPGTYYVTVESFRHSVKEVFVEVKGVYSKALTADVLQDTLEQHIREVRAFISERIHPYLNSFDQPRPDASA